MTFFCVVSTTERKKMYMVHTIAGDGERGHKDGIGKEAQFKGLRGITISNDRKNLYVADSGNFCIQKVSIVDGTTSTVAGIPGILKNILLLFFLYEEKL